MSVAQSVRLKPADARSERAIQRLRRSTISTPSAWILIEPAEVWIANQRSGESATGQVRLSRATFEKFIRFYMEPQTVANEQ